MLPANVNCMATVLFFRLSDGARTLYKPVQIDSYFHELSNGFAQNKVPFVKTNLPMGVSI